MSNNIQASASPTGHTRLGIAIAQEAALLCVTPRVFLETVLGIRNATFVNAMERGGAYVMDRDAAGRLTDFSGITKGMLVTLVGLDRQEGLFLGVTEAPR